MIKQRKPRLAEIRTAIRHTHALQEALLELNNKFDFGNYTDVVQELDDIKKIIDRMCNKKN